MPPSLSLVPPHNCSIVVVQVVKRQYAVNLLRRKKRKPSLPRVPVVPKSPRGFYGKRAQIVEDEKKGFLPKLMVPDQKAADPTDLLALGPKNANTKRTSVDSKRLTEPLVLPALVTTAPSGSVTKKQHKRRSDPIMVPTGLPLLKSLAER
jgi:hypothetical protein